jgi:hypothetical protein
LSGPLPTRTSRRCELPQFYPESDEPLYGFSLLWIKTKAKAATLIINCETDLHVGVGFTTPQKRRGLLAISHRRSASNAMFSASSVSGSSLQRLDRNIWRPKRAQHGREKAAFAILLVHKVWAT